MIPRRRFLQISAAFVALPDTALAATWTGTALGARVSVTLHGPQSGTRAALAALPALLEQVETRFSLYRPDSHLALLNRTGRLAPDPLFHRLLQIADRAHKLTHGLFDPSVQPLWQALARGDDPARARTHVGWSRIRRGPGGALRLGAGQALTFNGIAQGLATDLVRSALARSGFTRALIDIGEQAALGGPFRLALVDPRFGDMGTRSLTDTAIATSSPARPGSGPHLLAPDGRAALWSSVSIEAPVTAPGAALADALSTAAVFLPSSDLKALKTAAGLSRITVIDHAGNLRTL